MPPEETVATEELQEEQQQAPVEETTEQPEQQAEEDSHSLREAAQELGYDVSEFETDGAVLTHLVEQARESRTRAEQLSQYQQLLAQQKPAEEPKRSEEDAPLWNPPEFNPLWMTQVRADESGNLVPINGGTPETVEQLRRYANWRQEQQERFWSQPFEYIRPFVEQVVGERTSSSLEQSQEASRAEQLIEKNADWIYADESRRNFSEDGKLFYEAVQRLPSAPSQQQFDYAMTAVKAARAERELAALKARSEAENGHEQKKKAATGQKPNASSAVDPGAEQNPHLSLAERMKAEFEKQGITAADLEEF